MAADILRIDAVDPEESLLNYGANSIDLVRLGNRLEQELGVRPRIDDEDDVGIHEVGQLAARVGAEAQRQVVAQPPERLPARASRRSPSGV